MVRHSRFLARSGERSHEYLIGEIHRDSSLHVLLRFIGYGGIGERG